jgi:hypothetical protein
MRFTVRELLLVTVIVAMGLGWWTDRAPLADRLRKAQQVRLENWGR